MSEPVETSTFNRINPMELPEQDPWETPLELIDPARPQYFQRGDHWAFFERLRKEAPVHYTPQSAFGPYWSVTTFKEIKQVDQAHKLFSSQPAITIDEPDDDFTMPMFIAMDQPKHDDQRKVVQPVVAPRNLVNFESLIRERTIDVLDSLPHDEEFNWSKTYL